MSDLTLRHSPEFAELRDTIREISRGEPVALISVPGNLGDALILQGSIKLLRDSGIDFDLVDCRHVIEFMKIYSPKKYLLHEAVDRGRLSFIRRYLRLRDVAKRTPTALVCGGGAWNRTYSQGHDIAMTCARLFERVVVLPSTFETAVASPPPGMTLFARDRSVSLDRAPSARFCHDAALYLTAEPVLQLQEVGWHFRTDAESSGRWPILPGNEDLSLLGDERSDIEIMFERVGRSSAIVTDRLHVAIAGTLLGRDVYLFASNYFKISAIFTASLQGRFERTHLMADIGDLPDRLKHAMNAVSAA